MTVYGHPSRSGVTQRSSSGPRFYTLPCYLLERRDRGTCNTVAFKRLRDETVSFHVLNELTQHLRSHFAPTPGDTHRLPDDHEGHCQVGGEAAVE
ncbi:hypothetical protein OKW37_002406 [Paraburkholderia sp. MM5482-R2]